MFRFLGSTASSCINEENRLGDKVSPCLTPDDISNHSVLQLLIFTHDTLFCYIVLIVNI